MAETRDVSVSAPLDGATFATDVSESLKKVANHSAGLAISPTGTNAYTFGIDLPAGFSEHPDGCVISVQIPNTNTGAVTFEITGLATSLGTKAAVDEAGAAFIGGELAGGSVYSFVFANNAWVLQSPRAESEAVASGQVNFLYVEEFSFSGSLTIPHKCKARIHAIGAGGSGGYYFNARASGGGAGGHTVKDIELNAGTVLTITVGAGGAPTTVSNTAGNDGGQTSVVGTDVNDAGDNLNVIGLGGKAGIPALSGTAAGGAGGGGSGGDVTWQGGDGADASIAAGTGGGAVGFGQNGPDATSTSGASLRTGGTPAIAFNQTTFPPFDLKGLQGGASDNVGDDFCGGGGGNNGVGRAGGVGAGGGGGRTGGSSGAGGFGKVVILFSLEIA